MPIENLKQLWPDVTFELIKNKISLPDCQHIWRRGRKWRKVSTTTPSSAIPVRRDCRAAWVCIAETVIVNVSAGGTVISTTYYNRNAHDGQLLGCVVEVRQSRCRQTLYLNIKFFRKESKMAKNMHTLKIIIAIQCKQLQYAVIIVVIINVIIKYWHFR